jgi:hypothetical protein
MDDVAVYTPSTSTWFVRKSSTGNTDVTVFGIAGDTPFTGDMDADGKADYGVYRTGVWQCKMSGGGYYDEEFGEKGDVLAPGDYDNDGLTDYAVNRDAGGLKMWIYRSSYDGTYRSFQWGLTGDKAVPGDYDGDGYTDQAIYRDGHWWIKESGAGTLYAYFGFGTDKPIPWTYLPR